ncbi:anion permease, partial [Candidatus Bathyarchaeota archaeon]|nr:anion permease [Candidatus Bathyarchaeota archaeon]
MGWRRRIWILLIIGVIVLASYLLTGELTPKERGGLVILLLTASLWISEAIPLPATSLLVPFLQPLFGLQSFSSALEPFFAPVVALLLGGFLLAKAVEKHDLDEYLANLILSKVRAKPRIVVLALMSATAFLSMWMSNTASAALMLTIALRLVAAIEERDPNLSKVIVLGVAYSSTVGGIATLVGTPTCALAAGALRDLLGYELTFLGWSLYGLPITVAMILIIWLLLFALFRPRIGEIPRAVKRVGPLKRRQKLTLVIFLAAVLLWSSERLPEPLAELVGWRGHGLSSGMVSLLVAVVLFSTELLEGPDLSGVN